MFLGLIYAGFKPLEKVSRCTQGGRVSTEFFGKIILPDDPYKVFRAESLLAHQGDGLNCFQDSRECYASYVTLPLEFWLCK